MSTSRVVGSRRLVHHAAISGLATAFADYFTQSQLAQDAIREVGRTGQAFERKREGRRATWRCMVSRSDERMEISWDVTFKKDPDHPDLDLGRLHIFVHDFPRLGIPTVSWGLGDDDGDSYVGYLYWNSRESPKAPLMSDEIFSEVLGRIRSEMILYLRGIKAPILLSGTGPMILRA